LIRYSRRCETVPSARHKLTAYMVTGFTVVSLYAVGILRGRREGPHRMGPLILLTFTAALTPL
jgi:cytochrome d ubiquinol oxidase subunit I